MKKAVLVVPHEDDELLVGGAALVELIRDPEWEVTVVYLTTGDARGKWEGILRMNDAQNVLTFLGLDLSHIIYLGYANRWDNDKHIYNEKDKKIITSKAGQTETYGSKEDNDYSFVKSKQHNAYMRENIIADLLSVFSNIMPDLYIVVDMDEHEDHRAISLFVDECLCILLKEKKGYHPLVLKRFAYMGNWQGKKDYWDLPHRKTILEDKLPNPFLDLDEKISFTVPDDCNTLLLRHNTLYQAAKIYRTHYVWTRTARFANDDICFFRRYTENRALFASIQASSGETKYLNDFKLLDSSCIKDDRIISYDKGIWHPESRDLEKRIDIFFSEAIKIQQINIYECSGYNSEIKTVSFYFDNEKQGTVKLKRMKKNSFCFDNREMGRTKTLRIVIEEYIGDEIGISEIEVFDDITELGEYDLPFRRYTISKGSTISIWMKIMILLERGYFRIREYIERKVMLPKWEMKARYPERFQHKYKYLK